MNLLDLISYPLVIHIVAQKQSKNYFSFNLASLYNWGEYVALRHMQPQGVQENTHGSGHGKQWKYIWLSTEIIQTISVQVGI